MIATILTIAQKASEIAEKDPYGFIITLVAVSVVFLSLFMLQYCYRFFGWLSTREKKVKTRSNDAEVAAAIALALSMESQDNDEVQAAIAFALDRYLSESVHDKESYIITIKRKY